MSATVRKGSAIKKMTEVIEHLGFQGRNLQTKQLKHHGPSRSPKNRT